MLNNKFAQDMRAKMAKRGSLGLPPLLEKRRWEYAIPDPAFETASAFDRVHVWQVLPGQTETYGDTSIVKPQSVALRESKTAAIGVIVGIGLAGLDILRSNGMDFGHLVHFVQLAFYTSDRGSIDGHPISLVVLRAGDIIDSMDTMTALRKGVCSIKCIETTDDKGNVRREHMYVDENGKTWDPTVPFIAEDL